MRLLIIADAFPPMRTSCAVMLKALALELVCQKHSVCVAIPNASQREAVVIQEQDGVEIFSVKALQTKDVIYVRRVIAEFINPFLMWSRLRSNSIFMLRNVDGVIWYSPSIFWGPLVKRLKDFFQCKAYLVLRDIFPDWAYDLGVLRSGRVYALLKKVSEYQYDQANCIGVQSPNNRSYLLKRYPHLSTKVEVLWNWVTPSKNIPCSIVLNKAEIGNRTVLVYAGNVGVAQGISSFINLLKKLNTKDEYAYVFVGRGSEMQDLELAAKQEKISSIYFFEEIDPAEIAALYEQCDIGLLVLDPRHQTHNIPGKFISYIQSGLPTLALANQENDLISLINDNKLGAAITSLESADLECALESLKSIQNDPELHARCKKIEKDFFSVQVAAKSIAHVFA
jgi:glycosyltransferase involved in cell wall biosynthesis